MRWLLDRAFSTRQKQWLKARRGAVRKLWIDRFRSFDPDQLRALWVDMGLRAGDTVLMHSAFRATNGFVGTPKDVIDTVQDVLGPEGTLAMMAMTYTTSTKEFLRSQPIFDVRRSPSKMGIMSEILRRQRGTLRSLSPTHSVIAAGPAAGSLLAGHESCAYPCGPGSPFEKMLAADAKMVFFDLPFLGFTFVHYIEHQLQDKLPFALYEPAPMTAPFVDCEGTRREARVFVFSDEAVRRRRVEVITGPMRRAGSADWRRIGNVVIVVASMADALAVGLELAERGTIPFAAGPPGRLAPAAVAE